MTDELIQRAHVQTAEAASRRSRPKEIAGAWRRRRLVFDFLESRRLLSTNVADFPIPVEGGNPDGIASGAGADKNVWFTLSSNNIGMINPKDTAAGVTQFPIPTNNSGDGPIAAGPDGNYWFFEETADQFGVVNPSTGHITEIPLLSISNPQVEGITAGPNGYVWFTASGTSQIGELNTSSHQITLFPTITPGAEPYGIVEGPDGNMWFTEAGANQIGMINPTTHVMREFPIDSSGNDEAEGVTVGLDGNLWFTLTGTDKIGVMSTAGSLLHEYSVPTANAAPNSITLGPDGNLWFTESAKDNVARITTAGKVTEFLAGEDSFGVTSGSDGNLWFVPDFGQIDSISPSSPNKISTYDYTTTSGEADEIVADSKGNLWFAQPNDNQVGKFNPTTGVITEFTSPTANSGPLGIAFGGDGNLYYTESDGSKIGVIDPSNGTIKDYATKTAYSFPEGIVYDPSGGDLWFIEEGVNKIGRFDPQTKAMSDYSIPFADSVLDAITVDPSGNVWFIGGKGIGYFSPNNPNNIQYYDVASGLLGIVSDSNGNIWVSAIDDPITSYYLDEYNPSTGALITQYTVPVGQKAAALTFGPDGAIWFAPYDDYVGVSNPSIGELTSSGTFEFYPTAVIPGGITSAPDGNIWFTAVGTNVIGVVTLSSTSNPTQLAVTTQPPGSVVATDGFGMEVGVENSAGNPDIDYNGTVTIALANNPGGDTLKGTLTATVNQGVAVFSGLTLKVPDSGYTITATASGLSSTTTDSFNVTLGATQLVVTTQPPASVPAGTTFSITVSAEDGGGNVDTTYNQAVTLSLGNANGATLNGVLTVGADDGVATFTGLSVNLSGTDYVILASSGSLKSATTNGFDVTTSPPYQLVVASDGEPPSSVIAGQTFALTIDADDQNGSLATTFDGSVALAISNNTNVSLQGNVTENASGGVITFSGLSIDTVGSFTIAATSAGLLTAATSVINVTPGQAVKLVVTPANEPPSTILAGGQFGFIVDAVDNFGNIDTTYNTTVAIVTSPAVTIHGSPTATAQNGVATFSGLSIDTAGAYSIQATSGSLVAVTTTSISVDPGPLSELTVTAQPPSSILAGGTFALSVGAADQYGNAINTFSNTVIIALVNNPGVTLYGTLSEPARSGVATFSELSIAVVGSYQIKATSGSLTEATSNTIAVSPAGAYQVVFGQQPSNTIAGTEISPVTVTVEDASGNVVATDDSTVTLALSSGTFADGSTTETAVASNGIATFAGLKIDAAGAFTLTATDGSLKPDVSGNFTINPATADHFVVTSDLSSPDAAGTIGTVTVTAFDTFNNPVSSGPDEFLGTVYLSSTDGQLAGLPTSYTFVAGDDGSHSFSNVELKTAGSQTIVATDSLKGSLTGHGTVKVVAAAPFQVVFGQQPTNTVAGTAISPPVTAEVEDQYGNVVLTDSSNVTLTLSSVTFDGGSNTATAAASSGTATFDALKIDKVGDYTVTATDAGLASSGASNSFTIRPAAAFQLVWGRQPTHSVAGLTISPAVTVIVEDKYTNVVTTDTSTTSRSAARLRRYDDRDRDGIEWDRSNLRHAQDRCGGNVHAVAIGCKTLVERTERQLHDQPGRGLPTGLVGLPVADDGGRGP